MLTANEIEKKLNNLGTMVKNAEFVNAGLLLLAVNENVVKAFCFGVLENTRLYLFTDMNRVIECKQEFEDNPAYNEGSLSAMLGLSKKGKWVPKARMYDFQNADLSHTIFHEVKERGFFGSTYSEIIFEFQENNYKITMAIRIDDSKTAAAAYREMMEHINKYSKKTSSEGNDSVEKTAQTNKTAKENSPSDNTIREIRSMYESGIITKEEMMELLSEVLRK